MVMLSSRVISVILFLLLFLLLWHTRDRTIRYRVLSSSDSDDATATITGRRPPFYPGIAKPPGSNYSHVLVVPKTKDDDVAWIRNEFPDLKAAIYEVDNSNAELRVPKNKGHEAMVYLTFIIDHYDDLPDIVIFIHAHQQAWHNNILLDLDMPTTIRRLRVDRIARQGYMNLRCHLDPGCPNWIHLDRAEIDFDTLIKPEEQVFSLELFMEMFPGHRPAPVLSQACCAQFAVSGERIRDNSKMLYEHLRNWLLATSLTDADSGRVFEYMWQYLFTRNAEYCPSTNACYCDGYGICFGSTGKLDDWLKKLKTREATDDELEKAQQEGESEHVLQEIYNRRAVLAKELEEEKTEAFKRGEEERYRAIERERLPKFSYG